MLRRPRCSALLAVFFATLALSLGVGACHSPKASILPAPEQPKTFLHVTNGEFLDAVVYIVNRGQRIRLGVASSNRTTNFEIPSNLIFGATPMAFVIDPIGGRSRPASGDVVIDPGDEVELQLSGGRIVLTKHAP
jgi:hypothetical protein